MIEPTSPYAKYALRVIQSFLLKGDEDVSIKDISGRGNLFKMQRACFVTLHKKDGSLRGCIGTIEPVYKNLAQEIRHNALSAAFNDNRFPPLEANEMGDLEISVDILGQPEKIDNISQLDPEKYGVIVTDDTYRKAVLLPGIESVKTIAEQVRIVKKKASLEGKPDHKLTFYRFTSTRYF